MTAQNAPSAPPAPTGASTYPDGPEARGGAQGGGGGDGDALWAAFETGQRWQICQRRYDWHDCQSAGHPIVQRGTDLDRNPVGLCSCEDQASADLPTPAEIHAGLELLEAVWLKRWAS